ncbi:MMP3 protein, partial [Catharus fuscescens]|nr:MMP3 protein [Catharus fuscescens]
RIGNLPFLLLLCAALSYAFPANTRQTREEGMQLIQKSLEKYYDFKKDGEPFVWKSNNAMTQKLKKMQEFFGLEVTGKLDSGTLDLVQKHCCGFPDVAGFSIFSGERQVLTCSIVNCTPDLHPADVNAAIKKAFSVWSSVTPLRFTKDRGDADITISFAVHNDFTPFDGPGGSLARAYAPGKDFGGDAHFDEDKAWTKSTEGTNLFYVAGHEFVHSLELSHSKGLNTLMYPVYRKFDSSVLLLHQDDITCIQYLYGSSPSTNSDQKESTEIKDPAESKDPALPNSCSSNLTFDAVTTFCGEIMFFKDKQHFWHKHAAIRTAEFELVSSFWPWLPPGVDAAYEIPEKDEMFIFKGKMESWVVRGDTILPGFPQKPYTLGFSKDVANAFHNGIVSLFTYQICFCGERRRMSPIFQLLTAEFGIYLLFLFCFFFLDFLYFFSGRKQFEFDLDKRKVARFLKTNFWFPC